MAQTRISLVDDLGELLLGRQPGKELRERIESTVHGGLAVVVDFAGVSVVSPSFADEVFARLDPALVKSGAVRFDNLGDDLVELASFLRRTRAAS